MRLLAVLVYGLCMVHVRSETETELAEDIRILEEIKNALNAQERRVPLTDTSRVDQVSEAVNEGILTEGVTDDESEKIKGKLSQDLVSASVLEEFISWRKPCCEPGMAYIDLRSGNERKFSTLRDVPEDSIALTSQSSTKSKCSNMAQLKVKFDQVRRGDDCCVDSPKCRRSMLKIVLELDDKTRRSGHMFNVGDSQSNNGYGGDGGHQKCDAEVHGVFPSALVYKNDNGGSGLLSNFANVITKANKYVTLYVSNNFVRIKNDVGMTRSLCDKNLFCLNGQTDTNPNEEIYIGLNRVVQGTSRNGFGVCSATLTWECPCEYKWYD